MTRLCARLQLASSPKEVTEAADITVAMLADPAAAVAVATGPNGAAAGLKEGALQPALPTDCNSMATRARRQLRCSMLHPTPGVAQQLHCDA